LERHPEGEGPLGPFWSLDPAHLAGEDRVGRVAREPHLDDHVRTRRRRLAVDHDARARRAEIHHVPRHPPGPFQDLARRDVGLDAGAAALLLVRHFLTPSSERIPVPRPRPQPPAPPARRPGARLRSPGTPRAYGRCRNATVTKG